MTTYCIILQNECCIFKKKKREENESIDGVYLFICCCVPTCEINCKEMNVVREDKLGGGV